MLTSNTITTCQIVCLFGYQGRLIPDCWCWHHGGAFAWRGIPLRQELLDGMNAWQTRNRWAGSTSVGGFTSPVLKLKLAQPRSQARLQPNLNTSLERLRE